MPALKYRFKTLSSGNLQKFFLSDKIRGKGPLKIRKINYLLKHDKSLLKFHSFHKDIRFTEEKKNNLL